MLGAKIRYKRKWMDEKGVSEVVGTILMLAITVTLFSSIMVFVNNIPMPNETPSTSFRATMEMNTTDPDKAVLNVIHQGGERLFDYETVIVVVYDLIGENEAYSFADGGIGEVWSVGATWTLDLTGLAGVTRVDVSVVYRTTTVIWASSVMGGEESTAPMILQRWVDANATTLTPDQIRASDTDGFTVFVRVTDADGDLSSVVINASSIGASASAPCTESNGLFQASFNPTTDASTYDRKPLFIIATDLAGHRTTEMLQLTVLQPDVTNIDDRDTTINEGGADTGGDYGLPSWLKLTNEEQGWVILGEDEAARVNHSWGYRADTADDKNIFTQGEEWIFIRVGSLTLSNIQISNNLSVISRLSGVVITPPSSTSAFYRLDYSGNAFVYEAKFNSSILAPGAYDIKIDILGTHVEGGNTPKFSQTGSITILPAGGGVSVFTPTALMYDMNRTKFSSAHIWGDSTNPFDLSDASKSIVWVVIQMQTVGAGSSADLYEVRIMDMRGRTNLFGHPPTTDSMLTRINADALNKTYYFSIDLRLKNGMVWTPGLGAYSITLSKMFDADEGIYTLSEAIWIRSAVSSMNYVVGTSGFGASANSNFDHFDYGYQIDNNKFFTTRVIEQKDETPGSGGDASEIVRRIIYFDIDEDGDRDILAAVWDGSVEKLGLYTNRLNTMGFWEPRVNIANFGVRTVLSMAYGDVDNDGDYDWAVALSNGTVLLYINDYPVLTKTAFVASRYFYEMRLADVTDDGRADLIAIGAAAATSRGANCRLYIYNFWTGTTFTSPPTDIVNYPTDIGLYDFDMADIDGSNGLDIAVTSSVAVGGYGVRWYERNLTYANVVATSDPATYTGNRTNTYLETTTSDNIYEAIREYSGDLDYIWSISGVTGSNPMLYLEAKVSAAADEGFYAYYSKDVSPRTWIFMFAIPASTVTDTTYSFPLPVGTSGTIHVRLIDASTAGSSDDSIFVDLLKIRGTSVVSYTAKALHGLSAGVDNTAIGIGNFNGAGYLDVALGRGSVSAVNGRIMFREGSTGADIGNIVFTHLVASGDTFLVRDVNGDGRADIVAADWEAAPGTPASDSVHKVYQWINLGSGTFSAIQVLDCIAATGYGGKPGGDDRTIFVIAVENPYG